MNDGRPRTFWSLKRSDSHGFDNTDGTKHVAGVYQWVDKVVQAQVYKQTVPRLLFDIVIPEPSTAYIDTQMSDTAEGTKLAKPKPFTTLARSITESNYQEFAGRYDVTGLEAPPPPWTTISLAWDATPEQDLFTKSGTIPIPDGYRVLHAAASAIPWGPPEYTLQLLLGTHGVDVKRGESLTIHDMSGESTSLAVAAVSSKLAAVALTFYLFCTRLTEQAYEQWQLKTHAAIMQAYIAKQTAYERALAEAQAAAGAQIQGRNPLHNRRIIETELRRQTLAMVTGQQFVRRP